MNQRKVAVGSIAYLFIIVALAFSVSAALPVDLGTAGDFTILSGTGISNTGTTLITGDIGVGPAVTSTAITGNFALSSPPTTFTTSPLVTGKVYAYDYDVPTPTKMNTAINDLGTAYTTANGLAPDVTGLGAGNIGGLTLAPGVYKWTTGVTIPTDVTLNGSASDVWIFQIAETLDISSATEVLLMGGAQAENIFWIVGGTTTLQTTSVFNGNILSGPGTSTIALLTGATLNGRALSQTDVTLQSNTVYLASANQTNGTNVTTLIVEKIVINDDNGTAIVEDFSLFINDSQVISGVEYEVTPGQYLVSEIQLAGYNATISGDCAPNGTVTLIAGEQKTCTITNNDMPSASTNESACYTWLKDIPAMCEGGVITQNTDLETFDNCRHITCENGTNMLDITACEKPDEINPTYFEMYTTGSNGTGIQICLGDACIANDGLGGFASQDFPVCTGNVTPPTNTTGNETNASAMLSIAPWYPKGSDYVFVCTAVDFTPTLYDWIFGDGSELMDYTEDNVYHIYEEGDYTVVCTAKNNEISETGTLTIDVNATIPPDTCTGLDCDVNETCYSTVQSIPATCTGGTVTVDDENGVCRTIVCENGSDTMQVSACDKPDSGEKTYFEMYKQWQTGTTVSEICLGTVCISDSGFASAEFPVCLDNSSTPATNPPGDQTSTTGMSASLSIVPWFPQGGNYVFECATDGFTATSYDWDFGDGQRLWDYDQNNSYHSYADGAYNVTCTAKDGTNSEVGNLTITVGNETG